MPDILADYREWRDQQAARVSTHSAGCHMWHERCMIDRLAAALAVEMAKRTPSEPSTPGEGTRQAACTLTDAERLLIQSAAEEWKEHAQLWRDNDARVADESESNAATLRGLLERTK
jgi:hypothetical protein